MRVDDHGSRAVDIMCKRHDRTHTLALSQSNTQTRCKDYCNAMTTDTRKRTHWRAMIQTACNGECSLFYVSQLRACKPMTTEAVRVDIMQAP